MEYKIALTEYEEIENLAHSAVYAHSKKDAQPYINRLKFIANAGDYAGSVKYILGDLCCSVISASGNVADKSRKQYFVKMDLSKLKDFVEE